MKVGVIEDSKKICYIIFKAFQRENINVETFESLKATKKIKPGVFAAFIVDYNLGDGTGIEFIKDIRKKGEKAPILMLTVRSDLDDKLESFKTGADDYMTKPFELAELVARIKLLINRSYNTKSDIIEVDGFMFDFSNKEITYKDTNLDFSRLEYQILEYLLRNRGQVIDKDKLLDAIWIDSEVKDPNIVNVYINRIRQKVKSHSAPDLIKTVRGFGYKIE